MLWYSFILPYNNDLPKKQEEITLRLIELINNYNNGERSDSLLIFRFSYDKKFVKYYFTSQNNSVNKIFVETNSAKPCELPDFGESKYYSHLQFLEGDPNLFAQVLRSNS